MFFPIDNPAFNGLYFPHAMGRVDGQVAYLEFPVRWFHTSVFFFRFFFSHFPTDHR
jgi:hypothetical protein